MDTSMFGTGRNWSRKSIEEIALSLIEEGEGEGEASKYDVDNVWIPCCDSINSQKKLVPLRLYKRRPNTGFLENDFIPMGSTSYHSGEAKYWLMLADSTLLPKEGEVSQVQNYFSNESDVQFESNFTQLKNIVLRRIFGLDESSLENNVIRYNHIDVTTDEHYTISNYPCRMFIRYKGDNSNKAGWYEIINKHYGSASDVIIMKSINIYEEQVFHKMIRAYNRAAYENNWKPFTDCVIDVLTNFFGVPEETAKRDFRTYVTAFAFGTTGALKSDIEPEYVTLKCPECNKEFNVKPEPYTPPEPGEEPEPQIFYCPYCGAEVEYTPPEVENGDEEEEDLDARYHFFKPFNIIAKIETKGEEEDEGENNVPL